MDAMLSALKELDRLYCEIENEVFGESASCAGKGTPVLSDKVIRKRQTISRMEQVTARFSDFAKEWLRHRDRLPPGEREQIRMLAEEVRIRAARLQASCSDCVVQLEAWLGMLRKELGHVRSGARFLQSSRPAKVNYPKFIDSHG